MDLTALGQHDALRFFFKEAADFTSPAMSRILQGARQLAFKRGAMVRPNAPLPSTRPSTTPEHSRLRDTLNASFHVGRDHKLEGHSAAKLVENPRGLGKPRQNAIEAILRQPLSNEAGRGRSGRARNLGVAGGSRSPENAEFTFGVNEAIALRRDLNDPHLYRSGPRLTAEGDPRFLSPVEVRERLELPNGFADQVRQRAPAMRPTLEHLLRSYTRAYSDRQLRRTWITLNDPF